MRTITEHAVSCTLPLNFLGESCPYGLASILVSHCPKCNAIFRFHTSYMITYGTTNHHAVNFGAVLGQIATGGRADHLEEQMACVHIPSLSGPCFIEMEELIGTAFEDMVSKELLVAGQVEKELAIANNSYHGGGDNCAPAITVVVDAGWNKRSHRHSYNANSGVGVIFGAATTRLLYIGVRNKYCLMCAVSKGKDILHQNAIATAAGLAAPVAWRLTSGFLQLESMHSVRYCWMIRDGGSSVYNSVVTRCTTYGRDVVKVECANHAVKCYRNRLEGLCNDKPQYRGKFGLSPAMMKRLTHGARRAIKLHSRTGDVGALRHDLRNGLRHYFGLHEECSTSFCHYKSLPDNTTGNTIV